MCRWLKPATHLAILIGSENRKRVSPPIDAGTTGDFFRRSRRCGTSALFPGSIEGRFEKSCDNIAQPDWLNLLAIRSNKRRKSLERSHLANAGEFNRRYLTCQISAKIEIAAPVTPGDFPRSRRSAYKIARCVAGFKQRGR